ncbi:MAG: histone deacetylase [Cyanobacteriota bacterium]|nr:histone deacetylase [Cyanobacteriota bacterium]
MLPVIYSDRFLDHQTGRLHPECPERLKAIVAAVKAAPWADRIQWQSPTPLDRRDILPWVERVHARDYIDLVRQLAQSGGGLLDMDTPVSAQSYDIALLAVSAWLDGVEFAVGNNQPVFVCARPPGHHAERETGMGFCLFSNAAIAAYYALEQAGLERVAILDWDVHHGNGTQYITENHPQIAYCSLHQSPCYPGTGRTEERGAHDNVLNIPLCPGSTLAQYQLAFEQQVIPFLKNFRPDLAIVSAGYDANYADPLAGIALQPPDYGVLTDYILQVTHRIVLGLEGGYELNALGQSVVATLERCLVAGNERSRLAT